MEFLIKVTVDNDRGASPQEIADAVTSFLPGPVKGNPRVEVSTAECVAGGDKVIACDQEHFDRVLAAAKQTADGMRSFAQRTSGRASERAMSAAEAGAIEHSIAEVKGDA